MLAVTISGQTISSATLSVLEQTLQVQDTLDQRSTCTFKIHDSTGTVHYQCGQPVTVTDTLSITPANPTGLIFSGYINDVQELNLNPNPNIISTLNCIDEHYIADKRVAQTDYTNWFAGDIVSDLLGRVLSQEGITASYALRRDSTIADWVQGILSNVAATTNVGEGDLELAPAGTAVTIAENTTATFNSGTLTNVAATSNQLRLAATPAIRLSGTSEAAGLGTSSATTDNYCYMEVWNSVIAGSSPSIASGDTLQFSIFLPSTNPLSVGGVDLVFDNGTALYQSVPSIVDQQGLSSHPGTDLSGYAKDQWYARTFHLDQSGSSKVGRSIKSVRVALKGDTPGNYIIYVQNILLVNGSGGTKATFFNGTLQTASFSMLSGYGNVAISVVTTYATTGNRISTASSIVGVGIARSSFLAWSAVSFASATQTTTALALGATGANKTPYVLVESSLDGGATWQICTNHAAIPGVTPGMSLVGLSLKLRETLSLASSDPTVTPALTGLTATVSPSYQTAKTDLHTITNTQALWNAGTITTSGGNSTLAAQTNNDLTLNGKFSNWANADTSNQTLFGTGSDGILTGAYSLTNSGTNVEAHTELTWAGTWGAHDFVIECDVFIDQYGNYGILYMTTNWVTNNNTWGYMVDISLISGNYTLTFSRGSNSGSSGSQTVITQVTVPVSAPEWHRVRIAYTQSSTTHNIYVDDVLYITSVNSAITGAGNVGVRYFNTGVVVNSSSQHSAYFQNFGVVAAQTGTWTSPGTSLTSVGTAGGSLIEWNATVPPNTSLLMYSSIDNGSTWQSCTNGAALPTPTPGTALSGKTLKIKATLTSNNANATVTLHGVTVWIVSQYSASGSRVSPALSLSSVGIAGSTLVSWNGIQPTNTTIAVDTSLDNTNWKQVGTGAQGSVPIADINAQLPPYEDTFSTLTTSFYTATSQSGGLPATWTWDTANDRILASGGANAFLLYNGLVVQDVDVVADLDQSDAGGVVWRQVDDRNFYDISVQDGSSPDPQKLILHKITGGVRTILTSVPISFTRGTPHRVRVTMVGASVTVYFDGTLTMTYADPHPLASGLIGLRNDSIGSSGTARFYRLRILSQGASVVGVNVFTRVRLTSTDPAQTPQLEDLTVSVHDPDIQNGVFIPSTAYSVLNGSTNTLSQDLDDLAKQSNYWWRIVNKHLYFQSHNGQLAPWILTDADIRIGQGALNVDTINNHYLNSSWVLGGTDTQQVSQTFIADGSTQSWSMDYPVDSLISVTVDGQTATFGIQNVDTGKQIYYTVGNNTITQDITQTPYLAGQVLLFTYNARVNVTVNALSPDEIARRAAIDGTSGIVEIAETAPGLNNAAALQLAQSRIVQYGMDAQTIQGIVMRPGLAVGQLMSVFLSKHGIADQDFLITDIQTTWKKALVNGVMDQQPFYSISATSGPIVASWSTYQAGLNR